jgi:hypothetical protein
MTLCLITYLALGFIATLPAWLHGAGHTLQCGGCADVGQEIWFLRWPGVALSRGHSPFVTSYINVPYGVNLTQNTSMPLVGVLGAPLIGWIGPVATFNLFMALGFATSAAAAFLALKHFVDRLPAAFVGGLIYGFSPFMAGQGRDHLFLVIGAIPPLMVVCLDVIVSGSPRALAAGAVLGLLAAAQVLISAEVLAIFGLVAAIGLLVAVVGGRRRLPGRWSTCLWAAAVAVVVFALLAAYPASVALFGPEHLARTVHPLGLLRHLSTDLAGIVLPGPNQRLNLGLASTTKQWVRLAAAAGPMAGDLEENGGYIGIPLLLLLFAGIVRYRKDPHVKFFGLMAGIALVFSLGSRLDVAGHSTSVPLPFAVLTKLPFLRDEVAARYSDVMWLAAGFLVACLLQDCHEDWSVWRKSASPARRRALLAAAIVAAVVTLASLAPSWPYPYENVAVPPWFTSPASQAVPRGTAVLAYPFPRKPHADEMLWQALDGIYYKIPGGQAIFDHTRTSATESVFDSCLGSGRSLPLTSRRLGLMRGDLKAFGISTVVIPHQFPGWSCATRAMQRAIGRPPLQQYSASVWVLNP